MKKLKCRCHRQFLTQIGSNTKKSEHILTQSKSSSVELTFNFAYCFDFSLYLCNKVNLSTSRILIIGHCVLHKIKSNVPDHFQEVKLAIRNKKIMSVSQLKGVLVCNFMVTKLQPRRKLYNTICSNVNVSLLPYVPFSFIALCKGGGFLTKSKTILLCRLFC